MHFGPFFLVIRDRERKFSNIGMRTNFYIGISRESTRRYMVELRWATHVSETGLGSLVALRLLCYVNASLLETRE